MGIVTGIVVGGFAVCARAVWLVSILIFGAKEETYEEGLAKQSKANKMERNKGKEIKNDGDKKVKNNCRSKKKGKKEEKLGGGLVGLSFYSISLLVRVHLLQSQCKLDKSGHSKEMTSGIFHFHFPLVLETSSVCVSVGAG